MSRTPEQAPWKWIRSRQASVVCLIVILLVVLGLSLIPRPEAILGRLSAFDKVEHFAAYVVLGFFAMRSIGRRDVLLLLLAIAASAVLGGLIEIIQPIVGRNRELADFLVDLGGAAVGAAVAFRGIRKDPLGAKK